MASATLRRSQPSTHNAPALGFEYSAPERLRIPGSLALLGAVVVLIVLSSGIYSVFHYLVR